MSPNDNHDSTMPPRISVIIPSFRQPEMLVLTLRDLSNQHYDSNHWEIIILDDGSKDGSGEFAMRTIQDRISLTIKRLPTGGKYSHAELFNELLRLANPTHDLIIHLEDVRIRPDLLLHHAKWHLSDEDYLVTGPMCEGRYETFDPSACHRWELMKYSGIEARAYRCCFQAIFAKSMSYKRSLLLKLIDHSKNDPFDCCMEGWGYHETEFAYRAEQIGAICIYDTDCAVFHPTHNTRDDKEYRGIGYTEIQSEGEAKNKKYICNKHGIKELPDWKIGIPWESPKEIKCSRE